MLVRTKKNILWTQTTRLALFKFGLTNHLSLPSLRRHYSRVTLMRGSWVVGRSLTKMCKLRLRVPYGLTTEPSAFVSFQLPRRTKTRQADWGGALAEIKSRAMETAGEEVDDLLTFSKALFRMRQNKAPAGIRRGDGYTIRLLGRRTFTVGCSGDEYGSRPQAERAGSPFYLSTTKRPGRAHSREPAAKRPVSREERKL